MVSRRKGRRLAVQALYSYDVGGADPESLLQFSWYTPVDSDEGLDFPRLLVQGALENLSIIDETISRHLEHWNMDRLSRVDLAILRMSAYCLLFQPAIPAHVTIDEAVELAKELSTEEAFRFVNGVLDGVRRQLQEPGAR
ncbi:MAG: transcription antitermination factor NusB [Spirochaetaceae bacterium]|nr:MAG: transcription antitermination factor NusB [Spirochaetaceae bacterium]